MLVEHEGRRPQIDPSASVAPTAVLSGDVGVGPGCWVLFGATGAALLPGTAFGLPRDTPDLAARATRRYAEAFDRRRTDRVLRED